MSSVIRVSLCGIFAALVLLTPLAARTAVYRDPAHAREITATIEAPPDSVKPRGVAVFLHGNGVPADNYQFLTSWLVAHNYLVVSVEYQLPSDPPLATTGDIYQARLPGWQIAVHGIRVVLDQLYLETPYLRARELLLLGHSNGGDIVSLFAKVYPRSAAQVIALDNRRMPIPRKDCPKFLSIRATEFQANAGVIPDAERIKAENLPITVCTIADSKHMDFTDQGPAAIKRRVLVEIESFLSDRK